MKLKMALLLSLVLFAAGCGSNSSNSDPTATSGTVYDNNQPKTVSTLAGTAGATGSADGISSAARFAQPDGVAVSPDGTTVYIADLGNHSIRKLVLATSAVTTIAGNGTAGFSNGTGNAATFNSPHNLVTDGTNLYVADYGNNAIRQVALSTGAVTTLAGTGVAGTNDGAGSQATFSAPSGLAFSGDKATLYVTDYASGRIRTINIASKSVGTVTTNLLLSAPAGIATDDTYLYVTEFSNRQVLKIQLSTGSTSLLAGSTAFYGSADALGSAASFQTPNLITLLGGNLYLTDTSNCLVRKINPSTGAVTTVAGVAAASGFSNGTGGAATFTAPIGIATDGTRLFIGDAGNNLIRQIQ